MYQSSLKDIKPGILFKTTHFVSPIVRCVLGFTTTEWYVLRLNSVKHTLEIEIWQKYLEDSTLIQFSL